MEKKWEKMEKKDYFYKFFISVSHFSMDIKF